MWTYLPQTGKGVGVSSEGNTVSEGQIPDSLSGPSLSVFKLQDDFCNLFWCSGGWSLLGACTQAPLVVSKVLWFTYSRWWTQSTPQFWRLHCFMTSTLLWFLVWIFVSCRERNKKQNGLEFCFSPKQLGLYFSDLVCCTFIPLLLIMLRWEDTAFLKVKVKWI